MSSVRSAPLRAGLFTWKPEGRVLQLSGAVGFPEDAVERGRGQLVFPLGQERGLIGMVAESGESLYVPDTLAEPRWIGDGKWVRSALFLPIPEADGTPRVLVLMSPVPDAFAAGERQLAEFMSGILTSLRAPARTARAERKPWDLEQGLHRVADVLRDLGIVGALDPHGRSLPEEVSDGLRMLSPRERQVCSRLVEGDRVSTIARELHISPNTVRNHLKAIFRKLGVRSQAELLERTRPRNAR